MMVNNSLNKILVLLLIICCVGAAWADDSAALLDAAISGRGNAELTNLSVSLDDSLVNVQTAATITFTLGGNTAWELIDGRLLFSFPTGFEISNLSLTKFSARHDGLIFHAGEVSVDGQIVSIDIDAEAEDGEPVKRGKGQFKTEDGTPLPSADVPFKLTFANLRNPSVGGTYTIGGAALDDDDRTIAGPTISQPFPIYSTGVVRLELSPDTALTLRAGDVQEFTVRAFDRFGNEVSDVEFVYFLDSTADSIGRMTDDVLLATTVGTGRVIVQTADPSLFFETTSGPITVLPGPLADIELDIDADQVVDYPLLPLGPNVFLRDAYGNLKTDHELSAAPLEILTTTGDIIGGVIDDQQLLIDGAIDLTDAGTRYQGRTAEAQLTARIGAVASGPATVWFHGYDILSVTDLSGAPLDTIPADVSVRALVVVQNNGRTVPSSPVELAYSYTGASGSNVTTSFTGSANGEIDSIEITLPPHPGTNATDQISIWISTDFTFDGERYPIINQALVDLVIQDRVAVTPVPDSFTPDTTVIGFPFTFDLQFEVTSFSGTVENPALTVIFESISGPTEQAVVYDDQPSIISFENGVIRHNDLPISEAAVASLSPGDYQVVTEYQFEVGGTIVASPATVVDTITLLETPVISLIEESFDPTTVFSQQATSFVFDVDLSSSYPVVLSQPSGLFTLTGDNFSATVGLFSEESQLNVGTNMLTTDLVFVPASQSGGTLMPEASIRALLPGIGGPVLIPVDLSGITLVVEEVPQVQIISLEVIAPNAPRVNTGQTFTLQCQVENLSSSPVGPIDLALVSDGASVFDSTAGVRVIPANDTATIEFSVTAASNPDRAEIFQVFLEAGPVTPLSPIDNIALVTIEIPARLSLEYELVGDANGVVGRGEEFTLSVSLRNSGEASTGEGSYVLSTGGVDFGLEDTTGTINTTRTLNITLIAPGIDTTATITFDMVNIPLDVNTSETAEIVDSSFTVDVTVQSVDGDVLVRIEPIGSPLVVPGRSQRLFEIILTNRGRSSVSTVELQRLNVAVSGTPSGADDFFVQSETYVLEDDAAIGTAELEQDRISLSFDDLTLAPEDVRRLQFVSEPVATAEGQFAIRVERDDFDLRFVEGPLAGLPVDVSSTDGGNIVFDQRFRVRGATIDESFVIEDNPFNPRVAPARFAYELPTRSGIEFRVFSLTGELVYSKDIPVGADGTEPNIEQFIEWDGANGPGDIVLNGVYIVSLRVVATGETVQRKVVVLK